MAKKKNEFLQGLLNEFIRRDMGIDEVCDVVVSISRYRDSKNDLEVAKQRYSDRPDIIAWQQKKQDKAAAVLNKVLVGNSIKSIGISDIND